MTEEIRQDGKVVLSSDAEHAIPMIFNNLCGKNFSGEEYRNYIRYVALGEMGFKPGRIELYRNGKTAEAWRHPETLNTLMSSN